MRDVLTGQSCAGGSHIRIRGGTGLKPGWSFDLTRDDPKTCQPWNFRDPCIGDRVREPARKTKPKFVISSPPCTAFSSIHGLTKGERDPAVVKKEIDEAVGHLK